MMTTKNTKPEDDPRYDKERAAARAMEHEFLPRYLALSTPESQKRILTAALAALCTAERELRSNAAKPNPELEIRFREAALAFVAAYRLAAEGRANG
jgi:hypothetical protein